MPEKGLEVEIHILKPRGRPGELARVEAPIVQVSGSVQARFYDGQAYHDAWVTSLQVRIGDTLALVSGHTAESEWSCESKVTAMGPLLITAEATARYLYGGDPYENTGTDTRTVIVVKDNTPPTLTVEAPSEVTGTGQTFALIIRGTATDRSGVKYVRWRLSDRPVVEAWNETGDWRRWRADVVLPNPGRHIVRVYATDEAGNTKTETVAVQAQSVEDSPLRTHPVLLLPLRLETRYLKNEDDKTKYDLWIRIYPDDIWVSAHEPRLTQTEFSAGQAYWEQVNGASDEKKKRGAWRELARRFGPERAAWIQRDTKDRTVAPVSLRDDNEVVLLSPRLIGLADPAVLDHALPDRFVVYGYRENGDIGFQEEGNEIRRDLSLDPSLLFGAEEPPVDGSEDAGDRAAWMVDLRKAEECGMAIRIENGGEKEFTRLLVVGMRKADLEHGQQMVRNLIESHHYGSGFRFVPYGTPTNNTLTSRSGYSDTWEDREGSFEHEILGTAGQIPDGDGAEETNAQRLGRALGLDMDPDPFTHIAGSADLMAPCAREMREAISKEIIWKEKDDTLLRSLLNGVVSDDDLKSLAEHFREHVWASGPLPTIAVGDQPYGVLPVSRVQDDQADTEDGSDSQLRSVLTKLHARWLGWAKDPERVPRVGTTDNPDEELQSILGMEPVATSYRVRPLVDERRVPAEMYYLYNGASGNEKDWYHELIQGWAEVWQEKRQERGEDWQGLTSANKDQLAATPLMHLMSWEEEEDIPDLDPSLVKEIENLREHVGAVLADAQERHPDPERLLRETLDLLSHRLDAWLTSMATRHLHGMRSKEPTGIYLGAYGWIEGLEQRDAESRGYICTPSHNQAVAAAVLNNAYLTHEDLYEGKPNPYRINLNSERVRRAKMILEGIRQGQPLGALLGYQFERALHERHLDCYIADFRACFPLVVGEQTESSEGDAADSIAARNVVDGLALTRWWQDPDYDRTDLTPPDPKLWDPLCEKIKPDPEAEEVDPLEQELTFLECSLDAVSDLLLFEAVYQASLGNYERSGAAQDAIAGKARPFELESVSTPQSGKLIGQRVCLLLPPAYGQPDGPRAAAEPRVAAWFSDLLGDPEKICCRYWCAGGIQTFFPIDVNRASAEGLASLPEIGEEAAQAIVASRELEGIFWELDDLLARDVPGVDLELLEDIRPRVTTGVRMLSLQQLAGPDPEKPRFSPVDLLYLSASPASGEGAEMEQRIAYHVRETTPGLEPDDKVIVGLRCPAGAGCKSLDAALELGRQILRLLGAGAYLQPGAMSPGAAEASVGFSILDADHGMKRRTEEAIQDLEGLKMRLGLHPVDLQPEDRLEALLQASRYEIPGAMPAGPDDPDLDKRCLAAAAEIGRRLAESHRLKEEADGIGARLEEDQAAEESASRAAGRDRQVGLYVDAVRALFDGDIVVLPAFTPPGGGELRWAFAQENLLEGVGEEGEGRLGEERVRLWLQQAALVHRPVDQLEQVLTTVGLWQDDHLSGGSGLSLRVAQLPYDPENRWVALDDEERGKYEAARDRGALSIVAAFGAKRMVPVLAPGVAFSPGAKLAGLLLAQWDEFIPSDRAAMGLSFQYDAPSTQAPQCLLLAVPEEGESDRAWTEQDLAQIVSDTLDLAKVRAVDLDAMRVISSAATGGPGVGAVLPALIFGGAPPLPDYDCSEDTVKSHIEAWIDQMCGGQG